MKTRMKKVFLFAPDWVGFISSFEKNLSSCGFHVTTLNQDIPPFRYGGLGQKIGNFLRKTFLRDQKHKQKLKEEHRLRHQFQISDIDQPYDYALIVRADFLSLNELEFIKKKSAKMISFHFDGMDRYPEVFSRIAYFDTFFVFDPEDARKYAHYNLKFIPNFFFDYPESGHTKTSRKPDYQLYYLGSYEALRTKEILKLQKYLLQMNILHKIELVFNHTNDHYITPELEQHVTCLMETISFEEHQRRIQKTDILLDFVLNQHTGLSFRVFESIKYEKKLITTNRQVAKYDFYNPDNIFILNNNYDELLQFIELPYIKLPSHIRKKYSFSNWIKNVFEEAPFDQIGFQSIKRKQPGSAILRPASHF